MTKEDAIAIIQVLQEKYGEGVVRKDKKIKDEMLRLIEIVRELGNV